MRASRYLVLAAIPLAFASLAFSGAYAGSAKRSPPPETTPAATPTGPGVSCIPLSRIGSTAVRDGQTIDFIQQGRQAWRNRLTAPCPGLTRNDGITYETSLSQLCNTNIVYRLDNVAGRPQRGAACSLGQFVPVELAR